MKYTTVIFDLDGTLLNTLNDLAASVNYSMRECGFPQRTKDEVRRFVGNGVYTLIHRAVPPNITEKQYNDAYNAFEKHYSVHSRDLTAPYKGIINLLFVMKEKGYKLAIVSNKIDFAVKYLQKEFFDGIIDVAIGDSDELENKPSPDMVYKAADMLGSEIKDCIYVGDTDVDLKTAENSGMPCISVSWGFRSRAELESYGADKIADKPEDILKYI